MTLQSPPTTPAPPLNDAHHGGFFIDDPAICFGIIAQLMASFQPNHNLQALARSGFKPELSCFFTAPTQHVGFLRS